MRRIFSMILCVILIAVSLTACSRPEVEAIPPTQYPTEGRTTALVPDLEATGELTLDLIWDYNDPGAWRAKKMYEELYPNVEINVKKGRDGDAEAVFRLLQTEIMAGEGPDVFLAMGEVLDLTKTMKAGAYTDLTPYFANDPDFNASDFNASVLYLTQYQGKQYLAPLSYRIPLVLTTEEILQETGFSIDACKDYFSTGDEIVRTLTQWQEGHPELEPARAFDKLMTPYRWPCWSGILEPDYPNQTVGFPKDKVRQVYDQLQKLSPYLAVDENAVGLTYNGTPLFQRLLNRETLFADIRGQMFWNLSNQATALVAAGETPVVFPYRNVNGNITAMAGDMVAVNQNCENKENAYRLVKLLMSPEYALTADGVIPFPINEVLPISNKASSAVLEKLEGIPNVGENIEGNVYIGGGIYPAQPVPAELVDQILQYTTEIDIMDMESPVIYIILEAMRPYIWGNASFDKCYNEAKNAADIYISE